MATKRTSCTKCNSYNIKELNPNTRKLSTSELCTIACECNECGNKFTIKSWTEAGRKRGIKY
jgi:RNase P subunit RPR2